METNNKEKRKMKNRNKRQRKKNQQGINGYSNNDQKQRIEEVAKCQNIKKKNKSPSPRPNNLLSDNLKINEKRNSGSECEEFQTPSIEYDIRNENIDGNGCEELNNDYDKLWEEIGEFPEINHVTVNNNICDDIEKNKDYLLCNGDVMRENIPILENKREYPKDNYYLSNKSWENEYQISEKQKYCLIENKKKRHKNKRNGSRKYEEKESNENQENEDNKNDYEKREISINKIENNYLIKGSNSYEGNNDKERNNIQNYTKDIENNENVTIIKKLSIEEEKNDYKIKYNFVEIELNKIEEKDCKDNEIEKSPDVNSTINESFVEETAETFNLSEVDNKENFHFKDLIDYVQTYTDEMIKEEIIENQNYQSFNFFCTEENLKEESLEVNHIVLNIIQQPLIQKSMTLKPRQDNTSFMQSATSITNVTSISDDNISLEHNNDENKIKKKKSNTFKIYTKFMDKFRREKTQLNDTSNIEQYDPTLSLKSENLIKNSEIESNQSLKSNNEIDNSSQILPDINTKEITQSNITERKIEPTSTKDETKVGKKENDSTENVEINKKKSKTKRVKLLKNLLKNKFKIKAQPKDYGKKALLPEKGSSMISLIFSTNDEPVAEKGEIDIKVIENFNEVVKSLLSNDPERNIDGIVITNPQTNSNVDVHKEVLSDSNCVTWFKNNLDDNIFPDAVTVNKINGFRFMDVPYIDDSEVTLVDSMSLYNGESKRCRIHTEFHVPMASMESLYFPGESMKTEKFSISQSPCRSKNVLENFFGCMSRRR